MEERKDYQVKKGYLLKKGWDIFKQNLLVLMPWCIVLLLPSIVYEIMKNLGIIPAIIKKFISSKTVILLIYIVWFWFWWPGTFTVLKKTLQGQPRKLQDLLIGIRYLSPLTSFFLFYMAFMSLVCMIIGILVALILVWFIYSVQLGIAITTIIGLPFLVFFAVLYIFVPLLIVDRQVKWGRAMTISRKTVWHKWASIFSLLLIVFLITLAISFGIVILWAFLGDIYPSFTKFIYYEILIKILNGIYTFIFYGYGTSVIIVAYHDIFGLKSNDEGSSIGNLA